MWVVLLSPVYVSLAKAPRSGSRAVQLVADTVRSFLWMRSVLPKQQFFVCLEPLQFNLHLTGDIHAVTAANNLLGRLRHLFSRFTYYNVAQLRHLMLECSTRRRSPTKPCMVDWYRLRK